MVVAILSVYIPITIVIGVLIFLLDYKNYNIKKRLLNILIIISFLLIFYLSFQKENIFFIMIMLGITNLQLYEINKEKIVKFYYNKKDKE